ncbi:HAD family hydrolase [Hydrocarboniclastica marina]|uniref:HAD family hydrolase n=1 Tax=Hydrocarboniclastica marina TaxID=2259620 RepID=A0A4P7XFA7_9ALTE|nr:HAD-IA family hydrolase [Hydrocarboniclastica marina]QCF25596.1 HAD family hydrolase [Hydrocarboniclastica marina]
MSQYRAVIFDWDGTLVDSLDHITASLAAAAEDCGMPRRADHELRDIIGLGLAEALERLWPGITPSRMAALRQAYGHHFFSAVATPYSTFDGVSELLQGLSEARPALAVATGKSRAGLDRALIATGLSDYFRVTRCADETRSKPHPLMLDEILQELSIAPNEALMIGDTVYDLEMAARIGMPSIGVTWGVHDAAALVAHNPVRIVDHVSELKTFLAVNVRRFNPHVEDAVDE